MAKKESPRQDGLQTTTIRPVVADHEGRVVPCLEILRGAASGKLHPLRNESSSIGRDPSCTLVLRDEGLSRRHAKIVRGTDGTVQLVDLGSTNGSYVNGTQVEAAVLRGGETLQFGPDFVVRFGYWREDDLSETAPQAPLEDEASRLSPRELEVARHAAQGLTNNEIAARLEISSRTVGTHLGNIYARLEIKSRAQLTRWVLEQGLS